MFESLLFFGAAGFVIMTLLGFSHGHSAAHGHGGGDAGHAGLGHSPLGHGGHSAPALPGGQGGHSLPASHGAGHATGGHPVHAHNDLANVPGGSHSGLDVGQAAKGVALMFLSPLDIFGTCLGIGAAGMLLGAILSPGAVLSILAVVSGFAFDLLVIRGITRLIFRFAATPSEGLEGMVGKVVAASTAFDQDGKGIVDVVLDGQTSQVLATLEPRERAEGRSVHRGDTLVIVEVDARRCRCMVSRDLAPGESLNKAFT